VVGVAVVERALSPERRIRALEAALLAKLAALGIDPPEAPVRLAFDRAHAGAGYAIASPEALSACEALEAEGLSLEPIYTGKAMAALLADARAHQAKRVLFWHTKRAEALPPPDRDWRARLPPALARRLAAAEAGRPLPRRRALVALGAVAAAVGLGVRLGGYPALPGFRGAVLAPWEAHVLRAAAEALLPPAPDGEAFAAIAANVDRYLLGMPAPTKREIHAMLALVEHATPLGGRLARFTRLSPDARVSVLERLAAHGGVLAQVYGGLRDLVYLAYYQQPASWSSIGYDGPRVALDYEPTGRAFPPYDALRAPEGALPKAALAAKGTHR
jgi:D-cysteine desulfhydrase